MKLSKRLKYIAQLVTSDYDHIWDCCCDHGLLGTALLNTQAAPNIHFVDIVPTITENLATKLARYYDQSETKWNVHCLDVSKLPIKQHTGKHLVIIAGIGVDLMNKFITDIQANNPKVYLEFILCPVNEQIVLRNKLIELNFTLIKEVLVEENRRFYEVLFVSNPHVTTNIETKKIINVGQDIWHPTNINEFNTAKKYLSKTITHYEKVALSKNINDENIINAYKQIERELLSLHMSPH